MFFVAGGLVEQFVLIIVAVEGTCTTMINIGIIAFCIAVSSCYYGEFASETIEVIAERTKIDRKTEKNFRTLKFYLLSMQSNAINIKDLGCARFLCARKQARLEKFR